VILDEPTAALAVQQTGQVLRLIRTLADRGLAVVVISHSLPDVFAVADRIWVLRLGTNAAVFDRATASSQEVVSAMTGGATLPEEGSL
jgi:ABC-type sugar transport system ATPase subunit